MSPFPYWAFTQKKELLDNMLKIKSRKSNNIIISKLKWYKKPEMSDLV